MLTPANFCVLYIQARYDLFCVKSAVEPQPTNRPCVLYFGYCEFGYQF